MRQAIDPELRQQAIAAVLAGESPRHVAKQYGVTRQAVERWRDVAGGNKRAMPENTRERIGELLLTYVERTIQTLITQAELASRVEWFDKQSAADLGVWAGVHVDKISRLMAAFQTVSPDDGPDDSAGSGYPTEGDTD